jgi:hypothetical protein
MSYPRRQNVIHSHPAKTDKSLLHTKIIHVMVRDMQALRRSAQVELIFESQRTVISAAHVTHA